MMALKEMRDIVQAQLPYDTGFMFLSGVSYFETNHFLMAIYDTSRVPYIVYNEEGTIYTQKNKGFISQKTVGAINRFGAYKNTGEHVNVLSQYQDLNNRRGSTNMIKQGALDKIAGDLL